MSKLYYTASGIITPIGGRPVHRLREDYTVEYYIFILLSYFMYPLFNFVQSHGFIFLHSLFAKKTCTGISCCITLLIFFCSLYTNISKNCMLCSSIARKFVTGRHLNTIQALYSFTDLVGCLVRFDHTFLLRVW